MKEGSFTISQNIHSVGLDGEIKGSPFEFTAYSMGELLSFHGIFKDNSWLRREILEVLGVGD